MEYEVQLHVCKIYQNKSHNKCHIKTCGLNNKVSLKDIKNLKKKLNDKRTSLYQN